MIPNAAKYLLTTLKKQYLLFSFILFGLILSTNSCKPKDNENNNEVLETLKIDFNISRTDSLLVLELFNGALSDIKIISLQLNNCKIPFRKNSNESITINIDSIGYGKNSFTFTYEKDHSTDSILKDYFHLMDLAFIVNNTYPHNTTHFTEGLLFDQAGNLMESTGLENNSRIFFYHPFQNGYKIKDSIINDNNEFGEGISIVNDQLVQLLWKNNYLKIYDKSNSKLIKNLPYQNEGWGLCNNGNDLYASNGTNIIYKIDVSGSTTRVINTINVQGPDGKIEYINELEWIDGCIFANVWQTNFIIVIDPKTGHLLGKLDLTKLLEKEKTQAGYVDVLNGIAWNKGSNTLLVTGKYWHNFYELKLKNFKGKNISPLP